MLHQSAITIVVPYGYFNFLPNLNILEKIAMIPIMLNIPEALIIADIPDNKATKIGNNTNISIAKKATIITSILKFANIGSTTIIEDAKRINAWKNDMNMNVPKNVIIAFPICCKGGIK